MSADNYLVIRKEESNWVAYMEFASEEEPSYRSKIFVTDTLVEAIMGAQEIDTEYGYRFEIDILDKESSTPNKDYFPRVCKYCGSVQRKISKGITMDGMREVDFINYDGTT